jgi:hypothetical protein
VADPRRLALHPLLFAAFPVLYLYATNATEGVAFADVVWPLVLVMGVTAGVFGFAWLAFRREAPRAGLAVSGLVVLFFSYGHAYGAMAGFTVGGFLVGRHTLLLPLWGLLAGSVVFLAVRIGRSLPRLTGALNVVAAVLVLVNVTAIAVHEIGANQPSLTPPGLAGVALRWRPLLGHPGPPDIYYLILDEYAGEQTLESQFGFDNRPFLDALSRQGFYVASRSRTNYPRTSLALAASLNMTYLDFLTRRVRADSADAGPLRGLMREHVVGRLLQRAGYSYVHIGSTWSPTATSPIADVNVKFQGLSEFATVLYHTTILEPIARRLHVFPQLLDARRNEWASVQREFRDLADARARPGPKFVLAHFLIPHDPFVFDRRGRFVTEQQESATPRDRAYVDQLAYTNTRVLNVIETLLSGPVAERPIVIVQSDEGPYAGAPTSWTKLRLPVLMRKFEILNAYYLPGLARTGLYPSMTPVNTFRLVFDRYFGARLPLLPDDEFVFRDLRHLYRFTRVTDLVE